MAFVDPDTIAPAGASPEAGPVNGGGFVDPDAQPQGGPKQKTLQDLSIPRQAASGLVGGPETMLSMGSGFLGMGVGGAAAIGKGAVNLATKGFIDPDDMASTYHNVSDAMTYEPRSIAGKEFTQGASDVFDWAKQGMGSLANEKPSPASYDSQEAYQKALEEWKQGKGKAGMLGGLQPSEAANRAAGELSFDFLINVLPILHMHTSYREHLAERLKAKDETARQEAEDLVAKQANSQRQTEMFDTERVTNPPQYGLPEELRKQQEVELNPVVEQRQQGQGELYSDHAKDEMLMGEGGTGFRDTQAGPDLESRGVRGSEGQFDSSLTPSEYSGPRTQGEITDNSVNYKPHLRGPVADMEPTSLDATRLTGGSTDFWNNRLAMRMSHSDLYEGVNHVRDGIAIIGRESSSPFYRRLSEKLLEDPEFKPDYANMRYEKPTTQGRYYPGQYRVTMKAGYAGNETALLHEATHARLYSVLEAFGQEKNGFKVPESMQHLRVPVEFLNTLYERFNQDFAGKLGPMEPHIMKNIHEFVTYGLTDPRFQAKLHAEKLPADIKSPYRRYWDAFVDSVAKMFGFGKDANTYFSELLKAGSDLMSGTEKEQRIYYSGKIDPTKNLSMESEKKGHMSVVMEGVRDFKLDRRPIEDVIQQLKDLGPKIQDFSKDSRNLITHAYYKLGGMVKANLLQDTTLKLLLKNNEGTGPLLKWVTDQVSRIDRDSMQKTKTAMDMALAPLRKAWRNKETRGDILAMWEKWKENIGVKDLGPEDFKTSKQWSIYQNFQKVHDAILNEINEFRGKAGLQPIQRIPSYFHAIWEGDYRVFAYDATNNKKWALGASNKLEAERLRSRFEKSHPDLRWETSDVKLGKYGLIDLSAFESALRAMTSDDPVTKAIQKTYQDVLQHRGFGRTGLHKEGVMGYMGFEKGALGVMKMDRAFEQYVQQAYRYTGNLEKQLVLRDMQKIPRDIMDKIPETEDFLTSYIHKARGAKLGGVTEDMMLGKALQALGLGVTFPKRAAKAVSQVASLYWLTTPRFIASQMVQSVNALPKLVSEHGTKDGFGMFFEGWKNTIMPDAATKEAVAWAAKKGYLDPSIANLVGKDWGERPLSHGLETVRRVAGYPAALVEHYLVRLPVFNMFETALRDSITDKEKRFEVAAEKTDYYMVNYGRAHAPMVYDRAGVMGDLARPLKQYSHNYIGQFIEYASRAKNKGEYAPLATFFGTQIAMAGLKGLMFVTECTMLINTINWAFQTDIQTPEQWLMSSNLHDALTFGGLSYVTGQDISSSVAAPGLKNMLSLPAIDFSVAMIRDVGTFALAYAHGEDTDNIRLRAWLAITPNIVHEYLRNIYTAGADWKGTGGTGPVPNPSHPMNYGNYRRSDAEQIVASLAGTKSINESKADALMRSTRAVLMRDLERRLDDVGAMTDRIKNGQPLDPSLIQDYLKRGGDPSRLSQSIMTKLREGYLTGPERGYDVKAMGPSKAHDIMTQQMFTPMDPTTSMGFNPYTGAVEKMAIPTVPQGLADSAPGAQERVNKFIDAYPDKGKMDKRPPDSKDDKSIKDPSHRAIRYRI